MTPGVEPKCNLNIYTWYLLGESKYSGCSRLAEIFPDFSHDCVNRFLLREQYEPKDLFEEIKHLINLIGGTVSVDDTVVEKLYSKPDLVKFISYFWSGNKKKTVKGINLITLYYTSPEGVSIPINYRLYAHQENKTKNDYFQEMLTEVINWGLKPKTITGDSWYSSVKNLKFLRKKELGIMMGISKNRQVSVNKGKYQRVDTLKIEKNGTEVYLKHFGKVKVFKKQFKNEDVRFYLVYLPENLDLKSVNRNDFNGLHSSHWGIECYHRALKQLCGIKNFLVRKEQAILNHFFCSIRSFVKLELMRKDELIDNWYEPQRNLSLNVIREFILEKIRLEFSV